MKSKTAEKTASQLHAGSDSPGTKKKVTRSPQRAQGAGNKSGSNKMAGPSKTRGGAREAKTTSKTAQVLELLKRPCGVTAGDLIQATGWQPHSVRGFLSGTIGKKMGIAVASVKSEDGVRTYSVKA